MIDNRKNNIWTVYVHIVPKTITKYDYDKYYVGITSKSVNFRWKKDGYGYKGQPFYNAIQKYGWDNIEHYIIAEHLTENEAKLLEIKLIKKLKCNIFKDKYGYNCTEGGDGTSGYIASEESRKKTSERTTKMNLERYKTKIYKFTDLGIFVEQFDYMYLACKSVNGCASGGILNALNNKQTYAYGYIWRYEKDICINNNIIYPINMPKRKTSELVPVYCFDLNGNFLKKLNSAKTEDGVLIHPKFLKGYKATYKGNFYRKSYDVILINNIPHMKNEKESIEYAKKNKRNGNKCIYIFDKNTKQYIGMYKNTQEFKFKEKFTNKSYQNCLTGNKCSHNNKYFRYGNDIGFNENNEPYFIK